MCYHSFCKSGNTELKLELKSEPFDDVTFEILYLVSSAQNAVRQGEKHYPK